MVGSFPAILDFNWLFLKRIPPPKKEPKKNYLSSLQVSPIVGDGSPIHGINFEPTNRKLYKSIKDLQLQPIVQVAFDCILFGKSSLTLPCLVPSSSRYLYHRLNSRLQKKIARAKLNLSM